MEITRTSILTGTKRTLEIPITEAQYFQWETGGALIQDAAPNLSADEREFIMTGVTSEEWEAEFPDDGDEG